MTTKKLGMERNTTLSHTAILRYAARALSCDIERYKKYLIHESALPNFKEEIQGILSDLDSQLDHLRTLYKIEVGIDMYIPKDGVNSTLS